MGRTIPLTPKKYIDFFQQIRVYLDELSLEIDNCDDNNLFQLMAIEQFWQELQSRIYYEINELDLVDVFKEPEIKTAKRLLSEILSRILQLFNSRRGMELEFYKTVQKKRT